MTFRSSTRGPVVAVEAYFVGAVDRLCRIVFRAVLHLVARQICSNLPLVPTDLADPARCDRHLLPWQPPAGVDNEVPKIPVVGVEQHVVDIANLAVARV